MSSRPPNLVVLASGEGSIFEAIVRASRNGSLPANVAGLITNRKKIGAIGRANRLQVPACILEAKSFLSPRAWDLAIKNQLEEWDTQWVVLSGFLARVGVEVLKCYPNRVINTHPALLPNFGGVGMYGDRVHAAVLAAGESETGITVHLVNELYDSGKILATERVEVLPGDTVTSLALRVKAIEAQFYPRVLASLVTGRINTG